MTRLGRLAGTRHSTSGSRRMKEAMTGKNFMSCGALNIPYLATTIWTRFELLSHVTAPGPEIRTCGFSKPF